jgi:hypothetical protein
MFLVLTWLANMIYSIDLFGLKKGWLMLVAWQHWMVNEIFETLVHIHFMNL